MKQQLSVVRLICQASSNPMILCHQRPTSFDPIYYDKRSTSWLPPNRNTPHSSFIAVDTPARHQHRPSCLERPSLWEGNRYRHHHHHRSPIFQVVIEWPIENELFDVVVEHRRCEEAVIQSSTKKGCKGTNLLIAFILRIILVI